MQRSLPCACDSEATSANRGRFAWNVRHEFDPTAEAPSSSNPCWKGASRESFAVGDCVSCSVRPRPQSADQHCILSLCECQCATLSIKHRTPVLLLVFMHQGFKFVWNRRHQNAIDLEHLRQRGDALADAALAELFGDGNRASKSCPSCPSTTANSAASAGCKRPLPAAGILDAALAHSGPACCALVAEASVAPAWVNWDEIRMGQQFFVSRLPGCAASLLFFSLVGGFGAPLISQVLARTGYLGGCTMASADEGTAAEATWKRVLETAAFVCEMVNVTADPRLSFQGPNGTAWRAIMRVRPMHDSSWPPTVFGCRS